MRNKAINISNSLAFEGEIRRKGSPPNQRLWKKKQTFFAQCAFDNEVVIFSAQLVAA
jgi:hypothetical protein